jgi:hypothetical protein
LPSSIKKNGGRALSVLSQKLVQNSVVIPGKLAIASAAAGKTSGRSDLLIEFLRRDRLRKHSVLHGSKTSEARRTFTVFVSVKREREVRTTTKT